MNAEIRKLAYTSRGDAKPAAGLPPSLLRPSEGPKPAMAMADLRLEARIRELERDREEAHRAHEEALSAAREAFAQEKSAALAEQREALMQAAVMPMQAALDGFRQRQESFFAEAEAAVVRLTLSIAARVLHREAQVDALMLRGAVRIALEQVRPGSGCIVEVPEADRELWSEWIRDRATTAAVEVRGVAGVPRGYCRLEIGESRADVSVESQLREIERGFFDVLEAKQATAREAQP